MSSPAIVIRSAPLDCSAVEFLSPCAISFDFSTPESISSLPARCCSEAFRISSILEDTPSIDEFISFIAIACSAVAFSIKAV